MQYEEQVYNNDECVLLVIGYKVELEKQNFLSRIIKIYEYITKCTSSNHVGLSFGIKKGNQISIVGNDFSCWNGRNSGPSLISSMAHVDRNKNTECFQINANEVHYIPIEKVLWQEIFDIITQQKMTMQKLPYTGIPYPKFSKIVSDGFYYKCSRLFSWSKINLTQSEVEERLLLIQNECQCAQFTLAVVWYVVSKKFEQKRDEKYSIRCLFAQGSFLHPCTLLHCIQKTDLFCTIPINANQYKSIFSTSYEKYKIITNTTVNIFTADACTNGVQFSNLALLSPCIIEPSYSIKNLIVDSLV